MRTLVADDQPDVVEVLRLLLKGEGIQIEAAHLIRIGHRPSRHRSRVQISYEVTAPAGSRVRAESGSGRISIDRIGGPADAHSGSGRIAIAGLKGSLRAHTGSGRISVEGSPCAARSAGVR
jgi:hypothetical protein